LHAVGHLLVVAAAFALLAATPAQGGKPLPAHVYAPYFETWTSDGVTSTAQQSGVRYFTLAFLETLSKTSCKLAWNGKRRDVVTNGRYLADIASLRAIGGDVVLSFGGWLADQHGREIADSCRSVPAIAAAYKDVITRYDVTRVDMDIEGRSLRHAAGVDRRNKALKLVEDWAAAQRRPLQVGYTLPTTASGPTSRTLAVLRNAVANGTRIDVVNIMAFDYYDRVTTDMGAAALTAADGLVTQLQTLYPAKSTADLAAMVGITLMPGFDDSPRKREKTTLADAQEVYDYAVANGFSTLSIWSIQRDSAGFSDLLAAFTAT
jgi:hypothetical protein